MKKALIIIAVIVLGLLVVGYVNQPTNEYQPSNTYSDSYKQSFMTGCTNEGANNAYCSCTYDRLEALYGVQGLVDESPRISRGNLNSKEKAIVTDCSALL